MYKVDYGHVIEEGHVVESLRPFLISFLRKEVDYYCFYNLQDKFLLKGY